MSNEIITLVKDTSLARIIAISELIKSGESFMKSDGITLAAVLYRPVLSGLQRHPDPSLQFH